MERSYNWLMVHLLSHNDKIHGCEVNIPEQVVFFDQKPKYFLKNDKDGCVMQFNKSKTEKADVHAHFIGLAVERRKNQVDDFFFQSQSQSNSQPPTAPQNEPVTPSLHGQEDSIVDGKTNYRLDSIN